MVDSLLRCARIVIGVDPFGQMILACRLCLHASITALYSSLGIDIVKLSPLRTACGNYDEGISHKWDKACAKVFGGVLEFCDDVFSCLGSV
jgi:hypothetical protein